MSQSGFMLPSEPMGDPVVPDSDTVMLLGEGGDLDEGGDADYEGGDSDPTQSAVSYQEFGDADMGDIGYDEMGAPIVLRGSTKVLGSRVSGLSPMQIARAVSLIGRRHGMQKARAVKARAVVRQLSKNYGVLFERVAGGRVVSSTLGSGARLTPTMVSALKQAVHGSVPFQPQTFPFVPSGPDVIVDIRTAINAVVGSIFPIYYCGIIITLQASVFTTNVGAFITITRNLGSIPVPLSLVQLIQLESGVRNVQVLDLNGALIAGHPRFYAPLITGSAIVDPTTEVRISGLPAGYTASLRFLQPGDQQVDHLMRSL